MTDQKAERKAAPATSVHMQPAGAETVSHPHSRESDGGDWEAADAHRRTVARASGNSVKLHTVC